MKNGHFFPGIFASIEKSFEIINLEATKLFFPELCPETEVLGEMSEFEKKALIMINNLQSMSARHMINKNFLQDIETFEKELEEVNRKNQELLDMVARSLSERFSDCHFGFRDDGLIVREGSAYLVGRKRSKAIEAVKNMLEHEPMHVLTI